jgi:Family of unknown function (DUF6682)
VNVQDIINRVQRTFGDEGSAQINSIDIIRWINDAQTDILKDNENLLQANGTADIVAGTRIYTLPDDIYRLISVQYQGFKLNSLTFNEFNEYVNGYAAPAGLNPYGNGTPEYFTVWNGTIKLYPIPDTSITAGLIIYYVQRPATISNSADLLSVPAEYHNSIVNYCLSQAYELDENYDAADRQTNKFTSNTMKLNDANTWATRDLYPSISVNPEDDLFFGGWYYG